MKNQACQSYTSGFSVAMSLAALVLVFLFIIFPPITNVDLYLQKQIIGTAFAALCMGGIIAALSPGKCVSRSEGYISRPIFEPDARSFQAPTVKGHHPNCGKFLDHTVQFKGTVYCAACLGLATGSLVALVMTTLHFFVGVDFFRFSVPTIIIGESGILIGFIQRAVQIVGKPAVRRGGFFNHRWNGRIREELVCGSFPCRHCLSVDIYQDNSFPGGSSQNLRVLWFSLQNGKKRELAQRLRLIP
jgi:uncharacterized membrane protein